MAFLISSCKTEDIEPNQRFDLTNSLNGFQYEVCVVERNVNENAIKNVIFLLDVDDLLPVVLDEYKAIASTRPLVIIGVKSKEDGKRVRDYTPTEIDSEESGKADEFFGFIEQDLIPELASRQIIDSTSIRSVLGHSLGGLATCFAFTFYNSMFDNYIALSPALFWDDYVFFKLENDARDSILQTKCKVFLGVGENEDFGMTNGFSYFADIIETYYSSVELSTTKERGSHLGSRRKLINRSLKNILE